MTVVSTAPARRTRRLEISPTQLSTAVTESLPFLQRCVAARGGAVTDPHGGDPVAWRSQRNLQRHVANYLVATRIGAATTSPRRYLDVGCGVGGLAAWCAQRLGAQLSLVDPDPAMRLIAGRAFGDAALHTAVTQADTAELVTALEVVEHVIPAAQHEFVAALYAKVAPGGTLVLSTPDESGYPFGSSGYRPHVGCLDGANLGRLIEQATGRTAEVWQLDGGPFRSTRLRLLGEWVANHLWALATARAVAPVTQRVVRGTRRSGVACVVPDGFETVVVQPLRTASGRGTGLLARVVKPAEDGQDRSDD